MFKIISLLIIMLVGLVNAEEIIPYENIDSWLFSNDNIKVRRSNLLHRKASLIHAIKRREFTDGTKSIGYGKVDYNESERILQEAQNIKGEIVDGKLLPDETTYFYYVSEKAASVKATIAYSEDRNTNLNIRIIKDGAVVGPWAKGNDNSFTKDNDEYQSSVKRIDTEIKKETEFIIKISPIENIKSEVEYVLLVDGARFSERQLRENEFREKLRVEDEERSKRVDKYLKQNQVSRDTTLEDGTYRQIVDIENEKPIYYSTFNSNAAKSISLNDIRPGGKLGLTLTGKSLERSLGVWDAGAVRSTHQEVVNRVNVIDNVSPHSHSSHVGGTMIAKGIKADAKGMANEATLTSYDWNDDRSEMAYEANRGLLISQHSYGIPKNYKYSRKWDQIANQYPMYTISKSASNDGAFRTVSLNGNAKNVITIGSAMDEPNGWQGPKTNATVLSYFSSKGPAPDGRIKPDVLANGHGVYSMVETGNSAYGTKSGTSMSGPSFAGACALLQEHYYKTHNEVYMSSATLKALVIHSANEVDTEGPDYSSGWGYMNASRAAEIITENSDGDFNLIQIQTINNGDEFILDAIKNDNEDLEATIVWNDPAPNSDNGNALVNDLDLRVYIDGVEYLPWMMDWNGSTHNIKAKKGDNSLDNVEKVQIKGVEGSTVQIVVKHKGSLQNGRQKFSLVLTGVTINSDPFLKMSYPNGGEKIETYSNVDITWKSNVDEPVDIFLLKGNKIVDTIVNTVTNSGNYNWFVPDSIELSNEYKIRISCISSTDIHGESENSFSIIEEFKIAEFPFIETFDEYVESTNVVGRWMQEQNSDDMDWLVYKGVTPTGQFGVDNGDDPGTGPLNDHTSGSGNYIYQEASYNYEDNKKAFITSPKFDTRLLIKPKLTYWINMNSKDGKMGDLVVDIKSKGEWHNEVKTYSGDKGLEWFSDTIDISSYKDKRLQVRFKSTVGDSFYSDICIDDFMIYGRTNKDPVFITSDLKNAKEGISFNEVIKVNDEDDDSLILIVESIPLWLKIDSLVNDSIRLSGSPLKGDIGIDTLTLSLSDGYAKTKFNYYIQIDSNSIPYFTSSPITSGKILEEYVYNIVLEDKDNENDLEIWCDSIPNWLSIIDSGNGSALLYGVPQLQDSGKFDISVSGSDGIIESNLEHKYTLNIVGQETSIIMKTKEYIKNSIKLLPSIISKENKKINIYLRTKELKNYELVIFDNIGNEIYKSYGYMKYRKEMGNYCYLDSWNGKNKNKKIVGSGLYTLIIKIINNDGSNEFYKGSIGVYRQ